MKPQNTQAQVNRLHEYINDIWMHIQDIKVADERGRESRQAALIKVISTRKYMDSIGLKHGLENAK